MYPDDIQWRKMVPLVHALFCDGNLSEEVMWQTLVLIPKGDGGYFRGIDLVDILWKTTTCIINQILTLAIGYHDTLNGFW